jgi:hypothetical protein
MLDDEDTAFPSATFSTPALPQSRQLPPNLPPISPITQQPIHPNHMAPSPAQLAVSTNPNGTPAAAGAPIHGGAVANQFNDGFDSMLDADPFGLSASMQYPTNYSFNAH